jgi:hypothetical protein
MVTYKARARRCQVLTLDPNVQCRKCPAALPARAISWHHCGGVSSPQTFNQTALWVEEGCEKSRTSLHYNRLSVAWYRAISITSIEMHEAMLMVSLLQRKHRNPTSHLSLRSTRNASFIYRTFTLLKMSAMEFQSCRSLYHYPRSSQRLACEMAASPPVLPA